MRVLFASRPFIGHLYPMMPLAGALRADGHDVGFATAGAFGPEVVRSGMPVLAAGLDPRQPPPAPAGMPAGYSVDVIGSKVDALVASGRESAIDLIVREPTDFSGVFAAEMLDVPLVTLGRSQFLPTEHWSAYVGPALALVRRRAGLPPDPDLTRVFGACYLDMVPSWFQPAGLGLPPTRVEIRPEAYDGPPSSSEYDRPVEEDGRIYVTFGTVYNRNAAVVRQTVAAVSGLGRPVLCTVGADQDPQQIVPEADDHVSVMRYVPQSSVLPGCGLVVCHGGYSTVLGAICAGLPLVLVPQGSDHQANAQQCERLGVGVTVAPQNFSTEAVRAAARHVLAEGSYRARAQALAGRAAAAAPVSFGARLLNRLPALHRRRLDVTGRPMVTGPVRG